MFEFTGTFSYVNVPALKKGGGGEIIIPIRK